MAENSSLKRKLHATSQGESEPKRLRQITTDMLKQDGTANINHLPNEILEMIFWHLEVKQRIRNELVCRRWRLLQGNWQPELLITIARFNFCGRAINSVLSRCGGDLRKLEILNVHGKKAKLNPVAFKILLRAIVNNCPSLNELKLYQLPLSSSSLKTLSVICSNLKVACFHNFRDNIEHGLSEFLTQCKVLEVLDIEGNIGKTCFAGISKKLKILRLTHSFFHRSFIENVWERCDKLTELSLAECFSFEQVADILEKFWKKCKDTLRIFRLDKMRLARELPLTCLPILHNIEVLSLDMASDVTDFVLNLLTENCIALKDLRISNTCISDIGLNYLRAAVCLKVLDISRNTCITDTGINCLHHLPALEKLNVGFLPNVSLESFVSLVRSYSSLNLLDVRGNRQVSNEVVHVLDSRLRSGDLKGKFTLLVWGSSVTNDLKRCKELKLYFRHLASLREKPLPLKKNVWYL